METTCVSMEICLEARVTMRGTLRTIVTALILAALACPGVLGQEPERRRLWDFEDGPAGWHVLKDGILSAESARTDKAPIGEGQSLRIEAAFPEIAGAGVALGGDAGHWHGFTGLSARVHVPAEAPEKVQVIVYLKDSDLNYFQHFDRRYLPRGQWTDLSLDLTSRSSDWAPAGHYKPWDGYCRQDVMEFGVKFISQEPYSGPLFVDGVTLLRDETAVPRENAIYNLRPNSSEVGLYERFEVSFSLARTYDNPFDPDEVSVTGDFVCPDGSIVTVPGFFYQGYLRRMDRGAERLVPMGQSQWKVRFAPQQVGIYRFYVAVDDGQHVQSEMDTFRCVASGNHGFVRVSRKDPGYFEFGDGTFYFPIGQNIASVADERARGLGVSIPAAEGTYAYDRFLSKMSANGENFGRVWMSPWSFSIEWTKAYDVHFQGLGRYNLYSAWRLDHVVEAAREHNVYLMLLFTSHGELSSESESDFWGSDPRRQQGSPYSSQSGGPLARPTQLYSSAEAIKFYKRKVRYIVARWGYATSIMCWEVLNEADLGFRGAGDENLLGRQSADFVRQIIQEIRAFDPSLHLATSGLWQHGAPYAAATLSLPEMDFFAAHIFSMDLGTQLASDQGLIKSKFGKMMFVTESGLTPFAQDPEQTRRSIHSGLWISYTLPLPGTACPWWWVLIDQKDLYGDFGALAAFAKGEDRRGMNYQATAAAVKDSGAGRRLVGRCLANSTRALGWAYDANVFSGQAGWSEGKPAGASVTVSGLQDGAYTVEAWDTRQGTVIATSQAAAQGGSLTFELPPFAEDVAFKVIRP